MLSFHLSSHSPATTTQRPQTTTCHFCSCVRYCPVIAKSWACCLCWVWTASNTRSWQGNRGSRSYTSYLSEAVCTNWEASLSIPFLQGARSAKRLCRSPWYWQLLAHADWWLWVQEKTSEEWNLTIHWDNRGGSGAVKHRGTSCHAGTAAPSPSAGAVGLHTCAGTQPPLCRASQLFPPTSRQITSLGQAEPGHHLPRMVIYMVITATAATNRSHRIKHPLNALPEYPITRQAFRVSSEQTHKQQHTLKGFWEAEGQTVKKGKRVKQKANFFWKDKKSLYRKLRRGRVMRSCA